MKIFLQTTIPLFLLILGTTNANAQAIDLAKKEHQFYTAFVTNSSLSWKISLQQIADNLEESNQLLLAKGYYAAAGTALGNNEETLASELLDKGHTLVDKLLKINKDSPEANALLSAILGLKISLSPMKGMLYGSKSSRAANKGVQLAPDNAFTNYIQGNNLFYTPSMFGGDVKKSITFLEKAASIYAQKEQLQNWEYMNTLVLLGQAYHTQKDYTKAKAVFETALEIAPNFGWIQYELLPKTEKAMEEGR